MDRCRQCRLPSRAAWQWLAARLCLAGLPLVGAACTENSPVAAVLVPRSPTVVRGVAPDRLPPVQEKVPDAMGKPPYAPGRSAVAQDRPAFAPAKPAIVVQEKQPTAPEKLPPPEKLPLPRTSGSADKPAEAGGPVSTHKGIPISLDTVLRLAEEQNLQVGQARVRVDEAEGQCDLAAKGWMPDLWIGAAYFRHEGGIQLQQGQNINSSTDAMLNGLDMHARLDLREYAYQKVNAERKAWQQRGDLSRLTAETLLDATSAYVDLLAAQAGRAIIQQVERDLAGLLDRAQKLAETEPGARVEVSRIRAEIEGRRQNVRNLSRQAAAASAKLVYLLGLDPCTELVSCDAGLVPYNLVDVSLPCCDLVNIAITQGPGIQELARIVAIIEEASVKAQGPGRYMPVFEMRMTEGAFGAAPGDALTWDNRWDAYLQMRWNLTELCTKCEKQRIADAQRQQAHLAYDDLRAKLAAGVQESRDTILGGSDEIRIGIDQIRFAQEARKQSRDRLDNNIPGSSPSEVLLSLQAVALAQVNYVSAIRDYDKAQLRLMVLTGGSHAPKPPTLPAEEEKP